MTAAGVIGYGSARRRHAGLLAARGCNVLVSDRDEARLAAATANGFLSYDDPYDPVFSEPVLPPDLLALLERTVLEGDLGYKFLSIVRDAGGARS